MSRLTMNTDKLVEAGEELKDIAKEYNNILNEVYAKLTNMSNNGTWVSEKQDGSANTFIAKALTDKRNMQGLANSINSLGNRVCNYARNVNAIADDTI